jgi:class 3 adenylate cyclase
VAESTSTRSAGDANDATELRTFLIADVRGYTRFTQEHGDDAASELTARFARVVRETVTGFGGDLTELRGDEAMCVFSSPRQAVRAAVEIQRQLRAPPVEPAFPLGVGVGLDAGEAVPTEGGYRGRALNFAARLCSSAKGGEILVSEGLAHLAHPIDGLRFRSPRTIRLKGVADPVRVVGVESEQPLPAVPKPAPSTRRNRGRLIALAAVLAAAVVLSVLVWQRSRSSAVVLARASVVTIDARSGRILSDHPVNVGSGPTPLIYGNGALWTYNAGRQTLIRIDPRSGRSQERGIGVAPTDIAVGDGYEWLADGWDNLLIRYGNWATDTTGSRIHLPPLTIPVNYLAGQRPSTSGQVAVYGHTVWATSRGLNWPQTIVAFDDGTLKRASLLRVDPYTQQIGDLGAGPAGVWMENRIGGPASGKAALVQVAPRPGKPVYVSQGGYLQQGVAVASESVWFASGKGTGATGRTVARLDPSSGTWISVITPAQVTGIASGAAGTWAAGRAALYQLGTDRVIKTIPLTRYVTGIAVGSDRIWALIQAHPFQQGAVD